MVPVLSFANFSTITTVRHNGNDVITIHHTNLFHSLILTPLYLSSLFLTLSITLFAYSTTASLPYLRYASTPVQLDWWFVGGRRRRRGKSKDLIDSISLIVLRSRHDWNLDWQNLHSIEWRGPCISKCKIRHLAAMEFTSFSQYCVWHARYSNIVWKRANGHKKPAFKIKLKKLNNLQSKLKKLNNLQSMG